MLETDSFRSVYLDNLPVFYEIKMRYYENQKLRHLHQRVTLLYSSFKWYMFGSAD